MSNFTYEKKGVATYLVYTIDDSEEVDTMCLGMITNNHIRGLVPTTSLVLNGKRLLQYDVSSKVSVKQIVSDIVTSRRLLGIFSGIADAFLAAEEYMISPDNFVMDLEYMYVDVKDFHTELICVPVQNASRNFDLAAFLKQMMFGIRIDQNENSDYFTKLLNVLNAEGVFSLMEFKKVIDELRMEGDSKRNAESFIVKISDRPEVAEIPDRPVNSVIEMGEVSDIQTEEKIVEGLLANGEKTMSMMYLLQHYSRENVAKYKAQKEMIKSRKSMSIHPSSQSKRKNTKNEKKQEIVKPAFQIPGQEDERLQTDAASLNSSAVFQAVPKSSAVVEQVIREREEIEQQGHINFGRTIILDENQIGKTVVLGMNAQGCKLRAMLVRKKNNEQILVDKDIFKIGKQQGYVDYLIRDNAAISRSHANIVKRDNQYYVVDTNSTNHVYVNGQEIASNEEVFINSGAIIRLANEEFEFLLY